MRKEEKKLIEAALNYAKILKDFKADTHGIEEASLIQSADEYRKVAALYASRDSFELRIFLDGNQWCALQGENLQEGIAGFGSSPNEAWEAFAAEINKIAGGEG